MNVVNGQYRTATAFPLHLEHSTWIQHIPFAMCILNLVRPHVLVELGTYTGVSYCAFCQAVKTLDLDTSCFGIDTWTGDKHTGHYENNVYESLHRYHEPLYGHFSRLVRSTFDDASSHFADNSVDLLHIDGLHTYDAVKHDFDTWLPKMSDTGVILIHDINVREQEFGVWKFWNQVKVKYPHLEMRHGHGLGLLAVGATPPDELMELLEAPASELRQLGDLLHQLGWRIELYQQVREFRATAQQHQSAAERYHRIWSHRSVRALWYLKTEGIVGVMRRAMRSTDSGRSI